MIRPKVHSAYRYFLVFNQTSNNFFETPCICLVLISQCCSSSHGSVPALKFIHVLSLQASSDPTCDIGIMSFLFRFKRTLPAEFYLAFVTRLIFLILATVLIAAVLLLSME